MLVKLFNKYCISSETDPVLLSPSSTELNNKNTSLPLLQFFKCDKSYKIGKSVNLYPGCSGVFPERYKYRGALTTF